MNMSADTVLAGRYRLIEQLASGGMGTVWRAHDELLQRDVAVKLLHDSLAADDVAGERFRREALTAAGLTHPNMANVYDYVENDGRPGIVMELVDGETLAQRIARDGALPIDIAVVIASETLDALACAHSAGIVHRDIKPANILLTSSGQVKVTDFGIARALTDAQLTSTGTVMGTAHYSAPEQVRGEMASPATDVYSAGVVLYEMLTGERPFQADTAIAVAMKRLQEDPAPPRTIRPEIPLALEDVVMRALSRAPTARFANSAMMREALMGQTDPGLHTQLMPADPVGDETVVLHPSAPGVATPAGLGRLGRPPQQRKTSLAAALPWLIPLGAIALAVLIVLLLITAGSGPSTRAQTTPSARPSTPTTSPVTATSVTVPDVTGMTLDKALAALRALRLIPYYQHETTSKYPAETVFKQSVTAGERVDRGTRVNLTVARAPSTATTAPARRKGKGKGNG